MMKRRGFAAVFAGSLLFCSLSFAGPIQLDENKAIRVHLKNNAINVLKFPFVVLKAKLATEDPESFSVETKNTSVVIIPSVSSKNEKGDLLVFSPRGNPYLITIDGAGKEQVFEFITNSGERYVPPKAKVFETGRIERDVKRLIRSVVKDGMVPGYKKVSVKRRFETPDLSLQKDTVFDGGKYRVEEWFVQNKTNDVLTLDYENFYTNGILAISFEKSTLQPGQITRMWLIVDKATIVDRLKRSALK